MVEPPADAAGTRFRPADVAAPATVVALVDSHCHLGDPAFAADREHVLARARAAGVERLVTIGLGVPAAPARRAGSGDRPAPIGSADPSLALAEAHPEVFAAFAVHPHDAKEIGEETYAALRELWAHPRVIAVGETGLDYYYRHSPPETQRTHLRRFVREAQRAALPLVIHCRDAFPDLLAILAEEDAGSVGGVIHCFSGSAAEAEACLALGFTLSFSGIVTFKNAEALRDALRATPLDRLLIETDAPYLAPSPHRGRRNEPALVRHVAEEVARATGRPLDEIAAVTSQNAARLFRLR